MTTCQAGTSVLAPHAHKGVLFFWCPHIQEEDKVQINLELPLYIE
jgi:hypothetical protein